MKLTLKQIYYKFGSTPDATRMWLRRHDIPYEVSHNRILVNYSDLLGYRPYGKPGVVEARADFERLDASHERKERNRWKQVQSLDRLLDKGIEPGYQNHKVNTGGYEI